MTEKQKRAEELAAGLDSFESQELEDQDLEDASGGGDNCNCTCPGTGAFVPADPEGNSNCCC